MDAAVEAVPGEQVRVGAALDDAAALEHDYQIGAADRGEPVSDDERGAVAYDLGEGPLDLVLGADVDAGRRVVEDQNGRVEQQGPSNGEPLPLAPGQRYPALADQRVVAAGQAVDEVVQLRDSRRGDDLLVRCVVDAVGDVSP